MNNKSLGSRVNRFLWDSRRFSSALSTSRHYPFNYSSPNPGYFTGFCDAESCFHLSIRKNKKYSTGWVVEPIFKISTHNKDKVLLESLQSFFGGVGIRGGLLALHKQILKNHRLLFRTDKLAITTMRLASLHTSSLESIYPCFRTSLADA